MIPCPHWFKGDVRHGGMCALGLRGGMPSNASCRECLANGEAEGLEADEETLARLRLTEERRRICAVCEHRAKMPNKCGHQFCSAEPNSPHEDSASDYAEALSDPEAECILGRWNVPKNPDSDSQFGLSERILM